MESSVMVRFARTGVPAIDKRLVALSRKGCGRNPRIRVMGGGFAMKSLADDLVWMFCSRHWQLEGLKKIVPR